MTKIFIDPGHGGIDPGAVGNGLREKDLTLDISKRIQKYLNDNFTGHSIKMSRTGDTTLSLTQRANSANSWGADLFLSVHINAGRGTGYEDYIFNGNVSSKTVSIQNTIHAEISKELGNVRNRGKKRANFAVLRQTKMPAILTENLFIDTKADADKLKSSTFLNNIAKGHGEGIAKAFNLKRKSNTIANNTTSVKIRTGGLSNESLIEVTNYMRSKGWYGQITLSKKNNPTLLTGGLNPTMQKEFETWLKIKKWWYKIEK